MGDSRESIAASIISGLFVLLLSASFAFLLTMISQRRRLRTMAETDPLTGLLNRKGRVARIDRFLKANPNGTATEVFLDIDDFKIINGLYGHDIGDEALKNLARNLVTVFGEAGIVSLTRGSGVRRAGRWTRCSRPANPTASPGPKRPAADSFQRSLGETTLISAAPFVSCSARGGLALCRSRSMIVSEQSVTRNRKQGIPKGIPCFFLFVPVPRKAINPGRNPAGSAFQSSRRNPPPGRPLGPAAAHCIPRWLRPSAP